MKTRDELIRDAAITGNVTLTKEDVIVGLVQENEYLKKEVERLSAPLTIPEGVIRKVNGIPSGPGNTEALINSAFEKGIRWALEYLNAQRGGKP